MLSLSLSLDFFWSAYIKLISLVYAAKVRLQKFISEIDLTKVLMLMGGATWIESSGESKTNRIMLRTRYIPWKRYHLYQLFNLLLVLALVLFCACACMLGLSRMTIGEAISFEGTGRLVKRRSYQPNRQ